MLLLALLGLRPGRRRRRGRARRLGRRALLRRWLTLLNSGALFDGRRALFDRWWALF